MLKPDDKLFFLHVPSCGGTSFWSILRSVYGHQNVSRIVEKPGDLERFQNDRERQLAAGKRAVVGGHTSLHFAARHFPERRIVSILRDPVSREISRYYRRIRNGKWLPDPTLGQEDIIRFYKEGRRAGYREYFSSKPTHIASTLDEVKLAMEDNQLILCLLEELDQSLVMLGKELCWIKVPDHDHKNLGTNRPSLFAREVITELKAVMSKEIDLYSHARNLFNRKIQTSA